MAEWATALAKRVGGTQVQISRTCHIARHKRASGIPVFLLSDESRDRENSESPQATIPVYTIVNKRDHDSTKEKEDRKQDSPGTSI